MSRLKILNIWVDPLSREEAIARVSGYLKNGKRPHAIFASNPEKNFSVPADPDLYKVYKEADILLPDGVGVVYAARLLHNRTFSRIPGSEFIFNVCQLAAKEGYGVFVYGAREDVNAGAVKSLRKRFQGLRIVGRANGYENHLDALERINASKAEILFIALGSPKQEKWFSDFRSELKYVKVVQGIGGTLDTITGAVKRAPHFWCRHNLEWLYRLITDPRRISRQKVLPIFAGLVLLEKSKQILGLKRA
ncbi:MAG: putative N-acetylmannosaminyltransferase [Smithella sp. PtaU1.Bin162]|nr:MAG: putative N-acetylmannosaminyltransferase [Smithella sp. PtaU1.Bin162]